jgi:formylglycine-generating enzyme required for sulfatase activity
LSDQILTSTDYIVTPGQSQGCSSFPVGQKKPNELGIYDLTGNAWQWCSDFYGAYPSESQSNPEGLICTCNRVIRGGDGRYFVLSGPEQYQTSKRSIVQSLGNWRLTFRGSFSETISEADMRNNSDIAIGFRLVTSQ